jgi:hypothetical protein
LIWIRSLLGRFMHSFSVLQLGRNLIKTGFLEELI